MSVGEEGVVSSLAISASVALEIGCSDASGALIEVRIVASGHQGARRAGQATAAKRRMMEFIDCPRIRPNPKPAD